MNNERDIRGLEAVPESARVCVLTIGNFDGVHLGHCNILAAARELASVEGLPVVAMTFDPPPDLVVRPHDIPERLTLADERVELLLGCGADYVVTVAADMQLLCMSADAFVADIMMGIFAPRHVVEGGDFHYGSKRSGNTDTLRESGKLLGFGVRIVDPFEIELCQGSVRVSSTLIRGLLLDGRVADAAKCLGRSFVMTGRVVHGYGRGRMLDYPTVNLDGGDRIVPADGVYAGVATVCGQEHMAAISVGSQPTFDDGQKAVEAYLLDADGNYYEENVEIRFAHWLRCQEKFDSVETLKTKIFEDVQRVRELCSKRD